MTSNFDDVLIYRSLNPPPPPPKNLYVLTEANDYISQVLIQR